MTNAYWRKRREELLAQMESDEAKLNGKLARLYASEAAKLEREIASYYQRYGEDNVIQYRTLLAELSDEDRRLLIERIDEFARKYPQWAHLAPVRKSIYMLNELEGIQASIRMRQLEIGAIEQEEFEAHFERQARRAADLAAEEMGFGENFYSINSPILEATVGAAWASGESFSERIWDNREKLAAYLNDDFAKGVARGLSYNKLSKALSERFENVSSKDARRLIYTEGTFLFNESQAQVHEQDFEFYRLSCVNDGRVCPICRDLQAEQGRNPVRFSERAPGVNFPPLHPWCRCTYTVEVPDWDAWIDDYVARHGGDAVTPQSVSRFTPNDVSDALRERRGFGVDGDLSGMNPNSMNSIIGAFDDAVRQDENLASYFRGARVVDDWGIAAYDHETGNLWLTGKYFSMADEDIAKYLAELSTPIPLEGGGFAYSVHANATLESLSAHEIAHMRLNAMVCRENGLGFPPASRVELDYIVDEVERVATEITDAAWEKLEGHSILPKYDIRRISGLASESRNEAVAEAFATVESNGRGFSAYADAIVDEFEARYAHDFGA